MIRFDPLRPHRSAGVEDRYEITHGTDTVCLYTVPALVLAREIPVGHRPDCTATTLDGRYLWVACRAGLYALSLETLVVTRRLETGWVFGTNMMPDGAMLLHDAYGGLLVVDEVGEPERARVRRRLDVFGANTAMDTLGGKGDFLDEARRLYLVAGWKRSRLYTVDLDTTEVSLFLEDPELELSDDLVVRRDLDRAYVACYARRGRGPGQVAVVDTRTRRVRGTIPTGRGTCGLAATADGEVLYASNDGDDAVSVIDPVRARVTATYSARAALERAGVRGTLQGISTGGAGEVYVYGCSGNGLLARFERTDTGVALTLAWRNGRWRGEAVVTAEAE